MKRAAARKTPARKGTAPALPSGYAPFLQAVKERIRAAHVRASLAANRELIVRFEKKIQAASPASGGKLMSNPSEPFTFENSGRRARPSRKTPVHHPVHEAFGRSIIVFVTLIAQARRPLFANQEVHSLLLSAWRAAHTWRVGRYVVMPDHIHLFCAPAYPDYPPLTKWVQYWKSLTSRQWPRPDEQPVWQKSFWDTQLRSGESYARKLEYVRRNPVRAGLCAGPDEWPFQGEMTVLVWHD